MSLSCAISQGPERCLRVRPTCPEQFTICPYKQQEDTAEARERRNIEQLAAMRVPMPGLGKGRCVINLELNLERGSGRVPRLTGLLFKSFAHSGNFDLTEAIDYGIDTGWEDQEFELAGSRHAPAAVSGFDMRDDSEADDAEEEDSDNSEGSEDSETAIEHLMDIGRCSYDTAKDAYEQHGRKITKACDALIGGAESD